MMSHLTNVPKRRCMEEHLRVIREVKGLNVQKYFAEDKKTEHQIRAKKGNLNVQLGSELHYVTENS